MTFSDILKIEMLARRIQTKELAVKIGVSTVCVQHWRKGRWLPKVPQALALARLFGMSVEEMFEDRAR